MIVVLTQVAQPDVLHTRVIDTSQKLGRLVIGEVPLRRGDTPLEELRIAPTA